MTPMPLSVPLGLTIGLLSTLCMDFIAIQALRRKVFNLQGLQVVPALLGRWIFHFLFHRELFLEDVRKLPMQAAEVRFGFLLHYLIGAFLGLVFALCLPLLPGATSSPNQLLVDGFSYGLLTNVLPWGFMYPCMGLGFFANRLSCQKEILKFSFLNHAVFGLALGLLFALAQAFRFFPS